MRHMIVTAAALAAATPARARQLCARNEGAFLARSVTRFYDANMRLMSQTASGTLTAQREACAAQPGAVRALVTWEIRNAERWQTVCRPAVDAALDRDRKVIIRGGTLTATCSVR